MKSSLSRQRGATLIMGIIFLVLIMITVAVAFRLSTSNLKAVGNYQSQVEVDAAAQRAVESVISSDAKFRNPSATVVPADAYGVSVNVAAPTCIRATPIDVSSSADPNPNIYLRNVTPATASPYTETHWDIAATADGGITGATTRIHQGVRLVLPSDPNPCP
jgi:Tfp pilus assembly protein PilX